MARWQANLILLMAALIWGGTFTIQKVSGNYIDPLWFNGLRFLIGAAVLIPLVVWEYGKLVRTKGTNPFTHWKLFSLTGLILGAATIVQHFGILETSIANAGFLTTLYVPLTPILAIMVFGRRPHWIVWPAAAVCVTGTFVLSGGQLSALNQGDLLVIASALLWSVHILMVGLCMDRVQAPMTMACVQFLAAGALGVALGASVGDLASTDWANAWMGILFAGAIAVGVGFTAQVFAQQFTQPSDTAIMLSMEAVFAAIVGALYLAEVLAPHELLGCAIIFVAVLAVEIIPALKRPKKSLAQENLRSKKPETTLEAR